MAKATRGKATGSREQRGAGRITGNRSWSPEASALLVAVLSLAFFFIGYSSLFGVLGKSVYQLGRMVFGPAAWVAYLLGVVVGIAKLAKPERLSKRAWLYSALLAVDVTATGELFLLRRVTPSTGSGFVSGSYAMALVRIATTKGAIIIAVAIALVALCAIVGIRLSTIAEYLAHNLVSMQHQGDGLDTQQGKPLPPTRRKKPTKEPALPIGDHEKDGKAPAATGSGSGSPQDHAPEFIEPKFTEITPASQDDGPILETPGNQSDSEWKLPKVSLLSKGSKAKLDRGDLIKRGQVLQNALASHGVSVSVIGMTVGPTVTRYELELAEGVKVARVLSLQRDIAYAMAATDVRILAPIPGMSAIGIEVPNQIREIVTLGDLLQNGSGARLRNVLDVPLGKDISGKTTVVDIAMMPHVLIAGSTGSGKSSLINSILTSLLVRNSPRELRLILVDPKRVELSQYSGLPHLLTQVVVDPKKAANALNWTVKEMERRYDLLAHWGVRDISGYRHLRQEWQGSSDDEEPEELPYILVVVDELNDLMMASPRDVEDSICRIAQKARAVGIHLMIATQRPSVDVITGVIKTNVPSRIAFAVASQTDSRVILDQPGAEKLIGRGDLLLVTAASSTPRRLQAPWVSESEVAAVVGHWRRQSPVANTVSELDQDDPQRTREASPEDVDKLFPDAVRLVVEAQAGSTSMLQRRLKIGFARAGRLMDLLEERGIVGPSEGSKQRQVLVRPDELDELGF
jgi:S-DNA-T family DNA segregation ATPase FtsK/SpoIIIE